MNIRNLDYCLNTHELLFLGTFYHDYIRRTIKDKEEVSEYMKFHEYIKKHCPDELHDKIASHDEDKLEVDSPLVSFGWTIPCDMMWHIRVSEDESNKEVVDAIVKEISRNDGHEHCSGLYEITMNTILNTEALIAERPNDIKLDKWCDLNKIKKMIEDGDRIFGIDMHQSGDGESSTSIYAVSGWDSDAFKYADVQILDCECG